MGTQARYAYAFQKHGIAISYITLWHHLKRFGLNRRYQRLVYLERLRVQHQPLPEQTIRTLKRQFSKTHQGYWSGHIVGLDTFYVGHLKGVGRIYQLCGIDLCSRYGWAKLFTHKQQTAAIELVEHVLVPKFFANGVTLESVLTDNGSEFTATVLQDILAAYDIQQHRILKGKPMYNGTC